MSEGGPASPRSLENSPTERVFLLEMVPVELLEALRLEEQAGLTPRTQEMERGIPGPVRQRGVD